MLVAVEMLHVIFCYIVTDIFVKVTYKMKKSSDCFDSHYLLKMIENMIYGFGQASLECFFVKQTIVYLTYLYFSAKATFPFYFRKEYRNVFNVN